MLKRNPSIFLLIFVYLWIIPHCLSYQNAWVEPEELNIKSCVLATGPGLNLKDIKNGLSWQSFEYKPRCTRPLSSYFEIIDTKFRCWLWHYMLPHPSLSLTWIFSLALAPLFLYLLMRNLDVRPNTAVAMAAFYLATPGVISHEAMLFRPAKPMADFFIIFCLYLISRLKKKFLDQGRPIPAMEFLTCWAICGGSFYWDETALLIFPAALFIFPSVFRRKLFLFLWSLLPFITLTAYLAIIPSLCVLAGHAWPHLLSYDLVQSIHRPETIRHSIQYLGLNARNLFLETMGIFPFSSTAPKAVVVSMALGLVSWSTVLFYVARIKKGPGPLSLFLVLLLFFFNTMMSVTMLVWGPYYYGSFWSIFFVLFLSKLIEKSQMPGAVLSACFFFIIISAAHCFTGANVIYKKYHWYPYSPATIEDYFKGTRAFFDKRDALVFSDKDIKSAIHGYWVQVRKGMNIKSLSLPRELGWLPIELEPSRSYDRSIPGAVLKNTFQRELTGGAETFDWLVQKGYMVPYSPTNGFIKEDIDTTIKDGLKEKYPDRWEKILALLHAAQSKRPYFYAYTQDLNGTHAQLLQAIFNYDMAIKMDPGMAEAYNDRGNIYFKLGNFPQAVSDFTQAIGLKAGYEDAYYNLGLVYYKQGDLPRAVLQYSKAIEINPKDAGAYDVRAVIYYQLKEYGKAWGDVHRLEALGTPVDPQLISALHQATGNANAYQK